MADIIKTIGASGSGADYATWQAWYNARVGSAGDRYIGEIITSTGGLSTGLNASSSAVPMELVLRAGAGLEFDPGNPTAPHAIISSGGVLGIPATGTFTLTLENIELQCTSGAPTAVLVNMGGSTQRLAIRGCWLRGGRNCAQNATSGSTTLIENSVIQGAYRAGVHVTFAGATVRNTVITGCNIENGTTNAHCGIRKDLAGTVLENVVAYGNNNADFFGTVTNATVSYLASGDATASGTGALTGVTSAAFEDYAGNVFTAATGGVLDGTGPSGNDRGIVTSSNPTILLINPAANVFLARDKATNTGNIAINGTCTDLTAGATIEARFNGGSWQVIDAAPTGTFSGTLTGAAVGVGAVEVRVSNFMAATDSHANIAVGAKFLFWGQSNFSGRANNAQSYAGPTDWWRKRAIESNTQVVATADPFDTYTANGSIFPLLATQLTAALECPVLFIGVAAGGTSLAQWQPGQSLNNRMLTFYNAESPTGHVEAVASWIGEGDAVLGTAESTFKSQYNTVIDQLKTLTGADSLLVAVSGENTTNYANVRQWIKDVAASNANASDIVPEIWPLYQKIHYETDTETALAADAVGDGIIASFYTTGATYTLNADGAAWNYSGADANLTYAPVGTVYTLNADGASWSYSGGEASTLLNMALQADGQSLQYHSASAELLFNRLLQADGSEWSYAGGVASLTYDTGAATYTLVADGVSFGYSSANAGLLFNRLLSASGAQYSYSGGIASLTYSGAVGVRINGYTMSYGVVPISAAFAN